MQNNKTNPGISGVIFSYKGSALLAKNLPFAFPSIAEGFGLPVIEAMHFGKPIFLSTHTSLPEIGVNVVWYFGNFEADTMQAVFARGMEEYNTDNLTARITGHAAQFDWEKTAKQCLNLYQECLAI